MDELPHRAVVDLQPAFGELGSPRKVKSPAYGSKAIIPLEDLRRDFSHLTLDKMIRKMGAVQNRIYATEPRRWHC